MPDEKGLLTKNEIEMIQEVVKRSPWLSDPNFISSLGMGELDIIKITPENGIIIIRGNSETGFTHINERHGFWSTRQDWVFREGEHKVDNPSKFSKKSMPIFDYPNISDKLFKEEFLNTKSNHSDGAFDLFRGRVENSINGDMQYSMLLYSGTKILHTLYPGKRKHNYSSNISGKAKFRKGVMSFKVVNEPTEVIIDLPYLDKENCAKYALTIVINLDKSIQTNFLKDFEKEGLIKIYQCQLPSSYKFEIENIDLEMKAIYNADLSVVEEFIQEVDDAKK